MLKTQATETQSRLVARVLRDVLRRGRFESIADLKDELWRELIRLRIQATPLDVDDALTMVASNTPLVVSPAPPAREAEIPNGPQPIGREAAAAILAEIRRRLQTANPVRTMPAAPPRVSRRRADAARAVRMVMGEIADVIAHCEALERDQGES